MNKPSKFANLSAEQPTPEFMPTNRLEKFIKDAKKAMGPEKWARLSKDYE